jgi:hypothetical protein
MDLCGGEAKSPRILDEEGYDIFFLLVLTAMRIFRSQQISFLDLLFAATSSHSLSSVDVWGHPRVALALRRTKWVYRFTNRDCDG